MTTKKQKVVYIIASFDKSANEDRARHVVEMLKRGGCRVIIFDSHTHFSHMVRFKFFRSSPISFLRYAYKLLLLKIGVVSDYPMNEELKLRGDYIYKHCQKFKPKLIICQNPLDINILTKNTWSKTIYDAPSLFSALMDPKKYDKKTITSYSNLENEAFNKSDMVTFHWPVFFRLAKTLHKNIPRSFPANFGCSQTSKRASWSTPAKIIYIGNTNAPWVNPDQLSSLIRQSGYQIDVYGYETPIDSTVRGNFLGFLPNLDTISSYQFGLVTANPLMENFSSKHLMYFSYGLPVLCPEYRQDVILKPGTIYYKNNNFDEVVQQSSILSTWLSKQKQAVKIAQSLSWEASLQKYGLVVTKLI